MPGPLEGLRAVEMVGLGPGPFCGMLLADMGAEVLRVDRVEASQAVDHSKPATSAMDRGKQAVAIDLKQPDGVETLLRLMEQADTFFEVFRPGVAERLGIGPDVARARNPKLVYGRLTGWGQDGPYAEAADQRARRLRRRRDAARVRDRVRADRARTHRQRAGRRRGDGRQCRAHAHAVLRRAGERLLG